MLRKDEKKPCDIYVADFGFHRICSNHSWFDGNGRSNGPRDRNDPNTHDDNYGNIFNNKYLSYDELNNDDNIVDDNNKSG